MCIAVLSKSDLAMIEFISLDPEVRAYALIGQFLIGQFLKRWSDLEQQIHEAIGAALSLDETRRYILCANLQLRGQHTSNTSSTIIFSTRLKKYTDAELKKICDYTNHRNMVAHVAFEPDPDGKGVVFLLVKAKGEFSRPRR
jgi:hypothetical protein